MIPKECKRLAEVDFPIAEVSKHSAREKSIRHGHPSTLHLWWARRPLAACRAMLMALLLPDPADKLCPKEFKKKARELLPELIGTIKKDDLSLRKALLKFIADFANWDNSAHPVFLRVGRGLVKAAHPDEKPLAVDPFAGGGSIPLEALRIGCDTFASDLNPVACLILKVMLEEIPHRGIGLLEELRDISTKLKERVEEELTEFYPMDPDGSKPIAYLWARTVQCESPNCGAEIPLVRNFILAGKTIWSGRGKKRIKVRGKQAIKYKVIREKTKTPRLEFEIFEPKSAKEIPQPTVNQAAATCPCCGNVLAAPRVRDQLTKQRGGSDVLLDSAGNRVAGARLMAVALACKEVSYRQYRIPNKGDYNTIATARDWLEQNTTSDQGCENEWSLTEELPKPITNGINNNLYYNFIPIRLYGFKHWSDIFNLRQRALNIRMSHIIASLASDDFTEAILQLSIGKLRRHCNAFAKWHRASETVAGAFGFQAIPMSWDYPEMVPNTEYAGGLDNSLNDVIAATESIVLSVNSKGQVLQANATKHPLPDDTCATWFTDPPYYDAIPYAHLSDFFYVWMKRSKGAYRIITSVCNELSDLTPKEEEIIDDLELLRGVPKDEAAGLGVQVKDREFFESSMELAFGEGFRIISEDGLGCVVFAHKTTEGWEALLTGMINVGFSITASWPIATERTARLRARESAALATSIHLVCRPRPEDASSGDWGDVLEELPKRVGAWMERLQSEGIRGADLVFACIGPALEIYSRYSRVETAEGEEVKLDVYLEKVWEVVGRIALENVLGTEEAQARNGMAGALEEDARMTALFLWTLQSTEKDVTANDNGANEDDTTEHPEDDDNSIKSMPKGFSLIFDVAKRFAQPLGIHLDKWEGRLIETKKGVVRLLSVTERAKALFGDAGAGSVANEIESDPAKAAQFELALGVAETPPKIKTGRRRKGGPVTVTDEDFSTEQAVTTLDRVHAAMLLQNAGRATALRALLKAEQRRGPDFLRLANALSALYPKNSEEKRLLDAMLLAIPR